MAALSGLLEVEPGPGVAVAPVAPEQPEGVAGSEVVASELQEASGLQEAPGVAVALDAPEEQPDEVAPPEVALPPLEARVLQALGPEQAYVCGESRVGFPLEVECVAQLAVEFRVSHLVERAAESWPPEVWRPAGSSFFSDKWGVFCMAASPARIAVGGRRAAADRSDRAPGIFPATGRGPLRCPRQYQQAPRSRLRVAADNPNHIDRIRQNIPIRVIECVS